ncbi:MAG TPA: hydrogenase maturation protease [Actinomycetota bacterium]|nr:hydrogenase maturation protease [Actinomycetota bacterium]
MARILVIGAGDTRRGDEGAGVVAAERLRDVAPVGIEVIAPGRISPETLAELEGVSHVLVLDAIDVGRRPGSIAAFETNSLSPCGSKVISAFGVADLFAAVGQTSDAPEEAIVLAIQPGATAPFTALSRPVRDAIPEMVQAALGVLRSWMAGGPMPLPT